MLFGDCDPAGIVYTPRVAYYVVESIHEIFDRKLGGSALGAIFAMDIVPPARNLTIDYTYPMRWGDELEISVRVKEVRSRSFTFAVEAVLVSAGPERVVAFTGTLTQVCASPKTLQPIEIPPELRATLESMLAENAWPVSPRQGSSLVERGGLAEP